MFGPPAKKRKKLLRRMIFFMLDCPIENIKNDII